MTELRRQMDSGEYFEQYEKLIYKIAWKLKAQHGEDVEELVSEAHFHLVRLADTFDETKSSLCTWTYNTCWNKMKSYCINPKTHRDIPTDYTQEEHHYITASENWLKTLFTEVSEEAQALLRVIVEAPEELAEEVRERAPKKSRKAITNYMIDAMDWKRKDVKRVFQEVEGCLAV